MNERDTLKINDKGHLEIGGMDAVEIAKKFGTPIYVYYYRAYKFCRQENLLLLQ